MTTGIQLTTLTCPKCGSPLSVHEPHVFYYCGTCGAGFELDDEQKFAEVPVYFVKYAPEPKGFLPFWAFDASLKLHNLESASSSDPRGLSRLFAERGTIRFYVPAFDAEVGNQASDLTYAQREMEAVPRQPAIAGLVYSQKDARALADYLFLKSEIGQKGMVKQISYELTLNNPMLIVVGF
jgi:ribosomal protein S27AE